MKNITVFSVLLCLLLSFGSMAQTATGGCTSVTVSNIPTYPTVYFANVGWDNGGSGYFDGCDEGGTIACSRVIKWGGPTTPRFWLEQLTDQGWSTAAGPQFGTTFNNVAHGTYRVKCQVPNIAENACRQDGGGNPLKSRICLFNTLGQFIGYWGTWDNSPFGSAPPTYSNTVIVGNTVANDNVYEFTEGDPSGPTSAMDEDEDIGMDASASSNYDQWFLAIFEDGDTYNRYKSNGWTNGTVGQFDLKQFWFPFEFEPIHSYDVQFVVENSKCRNGVEAPPPWNVNTKTFFVCTAGSGCRFGAGDKEITLGPNPAGSFVKLGNFDPDIDRDYEMVFADISGRIVKSVNLISDQVDISDLSGGMFVVNVLHEGKRVFTAKLIVNNQ